MNDKRNARRLAAGSPELQEADERRRLAELAAVSLVVSIVFLLALFAPAQEGSPAAQMAAAHESCVGACVEGE